MSKPGVYESFYGNAVAYTRGKTGFDLDMGERIPISEINFSKRIRDLEEEDHAR